MENITMNAGQEKAMIEASLDVSRNAGKRK